VAGGDPPRLEVAVQVSDPILPVGSQALAAWIGEVAADLSIKEGSLGIRLTDDDEMRSLNAAHRGLDRTTDVLSFAGGETPEGLHLGDIVISVPTARRQAGERGHDVDAELRVLALHGLLHCLGYDHERDAGEMSRLEESLRERWLDHER